MLLLRVYVEAIKEPFQHLFAAYVCSSLKRLVNSNRYQLNLQLPSQLPELPPPLTLLNVPFSVIDLSKLPGIYQRNKLTKAVFEVLSYIYILIFFIDTGPQGKLDPVIILADMVLDHFPSFGYAQRNDVVYDIKKFEEMYIQSLYAYIFMMAKPYAALSEQQLQEISEQCSVRQAQT